MFPVLIETWKLALAIAIYTTWQMQILFEQILQNGEKMKCYAINLLVHNLISPSHFRNT